MNARSCLLAKLHSLRQRLNPWNGRKKTALLTALALSVSGIFYHQKAKTSVIVTSTTASEVAIWLAKLIIGYRITKTLNAAKKKNYKYSLTAEVEQWLWRKREYHKQTID